MALAIQHKAPFSPAATIRVLVSSLKPTMGASAPTNQRATESANWWTGTSDSVDDSQPLPTWVTAIQVDGPQFTELAPEVDHLADVHTTTDNPDTEMAALALAADNKDERAFLVAKGQIDWSQRSAVDFLEAIQLAFAAGAHRAASKIAQLGAEQYPDSAHLQTAARVLAPTQVLARGLPADPSVTANRAWLKAHRSQYRGSWIALRNGELLSSSDSFEDLATRFGISLDILYTRVV